MASAPGFGGASAAARAAASSWTPGWPTSRSRARFATRHSAETPTIRVSASNATRSGSRTGRPWGRSRAASLRIDLARVRPRPELASTGYCLAAPGIKYLVYAAAPGEAFDLALEAGDYRLTWLDPRTGAPAREDVITAAEETTRLRPPSTVDAAAHVVRRG
jgi:hypothetical protein